ncbi:MAG: pentapeptide repeat-containing protein, partial [Clostridia bacterium]|nr:pentapeptide repeat-containing protein [Clostridia bacterium]
AYAKHILWLNDLPGGKQLDMSGCRLEDINLANRKLLNANFSDALLVGCNMDSAELCFADFSGAFIDHCSMKYVTADEVNFRGATLKESNLSYIMCGHGNFAHGQFYKSDLFNCRIFNSCFEGTTFTKTPTEDDFINTDNDMTDEEWTMDTEGQVMQ